MQAQKVLKESDIEGPMPIVLDSSDIEGGEDTGVLAALKRSVHNINPANLVTAPLDNLIGPLTTQGQANLRQQVDTNEAASKGPYKPDPIAIGLNMVPGIGEWASNLYKRARGGDVSGALTEGAATVAGGVVLGKVAGKVWDKAGKADAYSQNRPTVFTEPVGHLRNALKSVDLDEEGLSLAGDMLKRGEARIGKPVKDVDTARMAEKAQFEQELMPQRRAIIDPQANVTVPGSRAAIIRAKIDAIPADIRPGTPEYTRLWEDIQYSVDKDLTIGELEQMNSSLNQQNRAYHEAKFGTALSKLESARSATDIAAEQASRQLMYEGMEKNGLGGAQDLAEINKRIGVGIKLRTAIDAAEKTARVEATTPALKRGYELLRGKPASVNESIAKAMMGWESHTPYYNTSTMGQPLPDSRQLPANAGPSTVHAMPEGWEGGTGPAHSTTNPNYAISSRPKLLTEQAGSPHVMDEGWQGGTGTSPVVTNPNFAVSGRPRLLSEQAGAPFTGGEGWEGGTGPGTDVTHPNYAKGPWVDKPIVGQQLPLQPTVIAPKVQRGVATPIFGVYQSEGLVLPNGAKLEFTTKMLDGTTHYHYSTPDGRMIETNGPVNQSKPVNPNALPQPPKRSAQ